MGGRSLYCLETLVGDNGNTILSKGKTYEILTEDDELILIKDDEKENHLFTKKADAGGFSYRSWFTIKTGSEMAMA